MKVDVHIMSEFAADRAVRALLRRSAAFTVVPLPDDVFRFTVNAGEGLAEVIGEASLAVPGPAQPFPRVLIRDNSGAVIGIFQPEEAARRYNISERSLGWLVRGETAGSQCGEPYRGHMAHRYTAEDCVRDAAPDLLAACQRVDFNAVEGAEGDDDAVRVRVSMTMGELRALRAALAKAGGGS